MATTAGKAVVNLIVDAYQYFPNHEMHHHADYHPHPDARFLQANFTETAGLTQTEIIRSSCKLYGSIFLVLFVLFLVVRGAYPGVYLIKKYYKELNAPVAMNTFGMFSWIWSVFVVQYEDIAEQCGMDASTTIRLLEFGAKLSFIGILNSIFLFPTYKYLGTVITNDTAAELSLSNLAAGHPGTIAATVAAYILFGSAMHMIDKDFEWFTKQRHIFLSKKRAQNYSIIMSGLPEDMRTDGAIKAYFGKVFCHNAVVDGDVALQIPNLERKVARRNALCAKFEHSINVRFFDEEEPTHKTKLCGGEVVESIPVYTEELDQLNEEITDDINMIHRKFKERSEEEEARENEMQEKEEETRVMAPTSVSVEADSESSLQNDEMSKLSTLGDGGVEEGPPPNSSSEANMVSGIVELITGLEGDARDAAFVSFRDLVSANLARQAVHSLEPWECVPAEPPNPKLINWKNVGRSNHSRKIGELISLALTAALCIFWTIPVSFVASLSNVDALTEVFPFLKEPVENNDWLATFLAQIAPLILVVFISILPYILLFFVTFEGLVEKESMQHPSLFAKLAAFTLIQTFFVSTISGSIWTSIQTIWENPQEIINLLATALPAQSGYFIQLIIVQNLLAVSIELLRISPVAQDLLRKIVIKIFGYTRTEKERTSTFLGLRSMKDPLEYYYGRELGAKTILLFMVLFVYGCMSPMVAYFTLGIFLILAIAFRNQFIFVYPPANDSGGKLWVFFVQITIVCMIIAEILLAAVLFLKKGFLAGILLIPLIVYSILFDIYFKRRHYLVTSYLPAGDAAVVDQEREGESMEWLEDAYLQPALKEKVKFPDNYHYIDPEHALRKGSAHMSAITEKAEDSAKEELGDEKEDHHQQQGGCIIS